VQYFENAATKQCHAPRETECKTWFGALSDYRTDPQIQTRLLGSHRERERERERERARERERVRPKNRSILTAAAVASIVLYCVVLYLLHCIVCLCQLQVGLQSGVVISAQIEVMGSKSGMFFASLIGDSVMCYENKGDDFPSQVIVLANKEVGVHNS
jgi:hypothetical protein